MTEPPAPRPAIPMAVPMAAHGHQIQRGHRTVLPAEPAAATAALAAALQATGGRPDAAAVAALGAVAAQYPAFLDGWARLAQSAHLAGADVEAYAFARAGYHRGLDRLRQSGWGGTGRVGWADTENRGFLRALHALMVTAARIGEMDEAERCRQFLLDLDPEDGLGIATAPPLVAGQRLGADRLP